MSCVFSCYRHIVQALRALMHIAARKLTCKISQKCPRVTDMHNFLPSFSLNVMVLYVAPFYT